MNVDENGVETKDIVRQDDGIRDGLTIDKLRSMKPAFGDDGFSTAGNS